MDYNAPEYDQPSLFDLLKEVGNSLDEQSKQLNALAETIFEIERRLVSIDKTMGRR